MSNHITIELCAEDRARLDRLAEALERRACDKCVATALEYAKAQQQEAEPDPIAEAARKALGLTDTKESPVEPQEQAEAPTPTTTPQEEETPTEEASTEPTTEKTVSRDELKAKVIKLCAKGLKEQTRDIVREYAQTVTAIPEDKLAECYKKLEALEG